MEQFSGTAKIMVIEDDPLISHAIGLGLTNDGFQVISAGDGKTGLDLLPEQPSLVVLDLMLPDLGGDEVCKRIRAQSDIPVIVISARDKVASKIDLLQLGADDYLVKPFDFGELLARIRALLRRSGVAAESNLLQFADIEMHLDSREVFCRGNLIELSAREFELLRLFLVNQHRVLSKDSIMGRVWDYNFVGDSNIVEVYIGRLRKKLGEAFPVQTVRGVGYILKANHA
jgi:two-component system response regulator MprA